MTVSASAVGMQAELGLQGVTDGEFRRGSWHMDFLYQIGGVEKTERTAASRIQKRGRNGRILPGGAPGRRQAAPRQGRSSREDFAFLKSVHAPS